MRKHRSPADSIRQTGHHTRFFASVVGAALCLVTGYAHADCSPESGVSTCIDADNLWFPTGTTRFVGISSAQTIEPGHLASAFGITYLQRPVVLIAASPDPGGRKIHAVDDVVDGSFLFSYALGQRWEAGLALPFRLRQTGAGAEAATDVDAEPITRSAVRDPRIGIDAALFPRGRAASGFWGGKARFALALPLGNQDVFAGERSVVAAPGFVLDIDTGVFFAATEIGARVRKVSEVAGSRLGSQLFASLGLGVGIISRERLSVGVEGWLLPTLSSQDRELVNGDQIRDAALIPAEWHASLRSSPLGNGDFLLQLGMGSALPLSTETRVSPDGERVTESFAGLTTPRLRVSFVIRYAPLGRDTDGDGLVDRDDDCPTRAEDRDGFDDADGCPDPDNDRDGIPDTEDRCRDVAETVDGFRDEDGCPDLDDDEDGVPDVDDRCRMQPEDRDGFEDSDGCAEPGPAPPPSAPPAPRNPPAPPTAPEPPGSVPPAGANPDGPASPDDDVVVDADGR